MNKVILMGRLTRDPEMRTTQKLEAVATITLAVKEQYSENVDFITVVAFRKTAEFIGQYFRKGQQVAVVGKIKTRNYDDKDGKKVYVTEVITDEVYFADSKKEDKQTSSFKPFTDDELPF